VHPAVTLFGNVAERDIATPDAGIGALETKITVPPWARKRANAAPASA